MKGTAWKFGDDVNTDLIIPARYLNTSDPAELALHCMEGVQADFADKVRSNDVIVAGRNFGCGSSREHAPVAIRACGAGCVIAASFARIFFRNAINIGLPIFESEEASREIETGDEVEVDMAQGTIRARGKVYRVDPYPESLREIIAAGGLIAHVKRRLAK